MLYIHSSPPRPGQFAVNTFASEFLLFAFSLLNYFVGFQSILTSSFALFSSKFPLLFNFQGSILPREQYPRDSLSIIHHSSPFVKGVFEKNRFPFFEKIAYSEEKIGRFFSGKPVLSFVSCSLLFRALFLPFIYRGDDGHDRRFPCRHLFAGRCIR